MFTVNFLTGVFAGWGLICALDSLWNWCVKLTSVGGTVDSLDTIYKKHCDQFVTVWDSMKNMDDRLDGLSDSIDEIKDEPNKTHHMINHKIVELRKEYDESLIHLQKLINNTVSRDEINASTGEIRKELKQLSGDFCYALNTGNDNVISFKREISDLTHRMGELTEKYDGLIALVGKTFKVKKRK